MILVKYIYKQLYSNLLIITLVLLAILVTNQFAHYLRHAADGEFSMLAVFKIMTLEVPYLLGYIIPLGLYLSILITLGRLCLDSEMTVMRACGMSLAQLTGIVMSFSLLVALVVAWLMIFAEPTLESHHQQTLDKSANQLSLFKILPAKFTNLKNGRVIYASTVKRDQHQIDHVFFAEKTLPSHPGDLPSWEITVAQHAAQQSIPRYQGDFIIFSEGNRYIVTPGQADIQTTQFNHYGILINPGQLNENLWPNNGTFLQLWHAQFTDKLAAALLQFRMATPLSVLLFALLAIPLAQVSPRQGKFARIIPALLIYISYTCLMFSGRSWIQESIISPTVGLWWLHGMALLLAAGLYLWQMRWHRIKKLLGFGA